MIVDFDPGYNPEQLPTQFLFGSRLRQLGELEETYRRALEREKGRGIRGTSVWLCCVREERRHRAWLSKREPKGPRPRRRFGLFDDLFARTKIAAEVQEALEKGEWES